MSVYLCGILMGNSYLPKKRDLVRFFDVITNVAQMMIFFLLGLLVTPVELPQVLLSSLLIMVFMTFIGRPIAVGTILLPFKTSILQVGVVSWAGLRGVASIVFAIYAVLSGVPMKYNLFNLVFCIVLLSLAFQGALLPAVCRKLKMIDRSADVLRTFNDYREVNDVSFVKPVPDVFIDTYMAGASGEYVKVYLYLLRHQQEEVSIGQIADALNHTEADVQRALAYWQRAGVLGTEVGEEAQRSFQETPGQQISPVFASTESLAGAGSFAPSTKTAAREAAACDMSRLTSDESFKQLIYIAQQYLNKLLTPTDCQILGNLYSNLGFSGELLEYLIEYCVQNHHTSLRYMEKVALGWHKRGIKDVEQAKASGRGYTKGSFAVMRAMGLSDRSPAEVESEFIEKWFWEYGFTRELIVEACSRTIRQIHKPSFDYADKILRDWKNAGVKSFRDVSELDKKRKEEGGAKRRQASAGSSRSSNRFHNLEEHGYDYDEMVWSMINGAQKTGGDDGTQ